MSLLHSWLRQFLNIEQAETNTITLKLLSFGFFNERMANTAIYPTSPLLTSYSLKPLPPLLSFISDAHLLLVLPIIAYWAYGLLFHYIDKYDCLPQYRLHTPAEFLKRNHVPMSEVVTYVLKYQALTTTIRIILTREPESFGVEEHEVACWARRVSRFRRGAPKRALTLLGVSISPYKMYIILQRLILFASQINASSLFKINSNPSHSLASWEVSFASCIYYYAIPAMQFATAIFFADT